MTPNLAYYADTRTYDALTWDARNTRKVSIHAVARNRSETQRKCLGVPENRSERVFQTAEAALATPPSYDALTRAGS